MAPQIQVRQMNVKSEARQRRLNQIVFALADYRGLSAHRLHDSLPDALGEQSSEMPPSTSTARRSAKSSRTNFRPREPGENRGGRGRCYFKSCFVIDRSSKKRCQRRKRYVCVEHGPRVSDKNAPYSLRKSRKYQIAYCMPINDITVKPD